MRDNRSQLRTKAAFTNGETSREIENREIAFRSALEGIVLLENDGSLPLNENSTIALFGAGARKTVKGGTGSGEVNERQSIHVAEGLIQRGFTIGTESWLDDYDIEFNRGLVDYRREVGKKLRRLNASAVINIMANPYQHPYGRKITTADLEASQTDSCVYVIARQAGEGSDRRVEEHHISLSPRELENVKICAGYYKNFVVVLNSGSSFLTDFMEEIPGINALIHMGQLGSMGGLALADILSARVSPSGKLTDSWAKRYEDIPFANEFSYLNGNLENEDYREGIFVGYRYFDSFNVEPRYPFGYGLGYGEFEITTQTAGISGAGVTLGISVINRSSEYSGKEVVQVYVSAPQNGLAREYQSLAAFAKSAELSPGEGCKLQLDFTMTDIAAYSEIESAFILTPGEYIIRVGNSSRNTTPAAVVVIEEQVVVSRHEHICKLEKPIEEISSPEITYSDNTASIPRLPLESGTIHTKIHTYAQSEALTKNNSDNEQKAEKLMDRLTGKQQIHLVAGTGMAQVLFGGSYFSCPGAVGNTSSMLAGMNIPNVTFADGPAGLRLQRRSALKKNGKLRMIDAQIEVLNYLPALLKKFIFGNEKRDQVLYQFTTAFPVEISMAQSWNTELLEQMGRAVSREMSEYGVTFWLGPGMNIHRNPLCGRNFEYYSEDPLLSGKLAGAVARGCQSISGNYATLKHYVANNQEDNRNKVSSNINERALREIYLKGFNIALRESGARAVMTSYNRVNSVYTANSHDLIQKVLRDEWEFSGLVMTDWGATGGDLADESLCIEVGNDIIMPGGAGVRRALYRGLKKGRISRDALRRSATRVLLSVLDSGLAAELTESMQE